MDFADAVDLCAMAATLGHAMPAAKWVEEGPGAERGTSSFDVLL